MSTPRISHQEFQSRIDRIQEKLVERELDSLIVYGDEYRKENLRYVANFWPIFERGACFIPKRGAPVLAGAPEGEEYAREMTWLSDVRNIKEFACVTVPEEIDYPNAEFSSLQEILTDMAGTSKRIGLVGWWDIPAPLMQRLQEAAAPAHIVDASDLFFDLRLIKTTEEIACLREAGRQACIGYEQLIANCIPGNTELHAAGAAEGAARAAGAEDINFMVFGSGPRCDTVIGRAVNRTIKDGDMIMAAMAVQYEGYVATVEFPFVAGTMRDEQKQFLATLYEAANVQQSFLKDGAHMGEMVQAVRNVFKSHHMSKYDLYPPMHGIGLAEAESPYPDENSTGIFKSGMCVNSDISLFGTPGGSNRIEEGFLITDTGPDSLTPYIRKLLAQGL